jgi:leader peptidase (prepilin peptidase) / N-methyltransferase
MGCCHVPVVQGKAVSRAGSADPRAYLAAFVGYDPAMTAILPALVAGLLGVPFGMVARALARRHCGRPAVPGTLLIEAVMAVLWALLALRLWPAHPAALPAYLALAFVCVTLAVIDLRTKLLPNRITYPALPLVAALLLLASAAEHHLGPMVRALEACGLAGVAFLALVLISPSGLGLGDVKFALVLGLALGWLGWSAVAAGFFGAFLLGGVAALVAVVVLRLGRKAQLPFGPWLAAGALLAVLAGAPLATT